MTIDPNTSSVNERSYSTCDTQCPDASKRSSPQVRTPEPLGTVSHPINGIAIIESATSGGSRLQGERYERP